jgi:hypothetical protein
MAEIKIWGKYQNHAKEELDTAKDVKDAKYLVGEYRLAFGSGWTIWADLPDEQKTEQL